MATNIKWRIAGERNQILGNLRYTKGQVRWLMHRLAGFRRQFDGEARSDMVVMSSDRMHQQQQFLREVKCSLELAELNLHHALLAMDRFNSLSLSQTPRAIAARNKKFMASIQRQD